MISMQKITPFLWFDGQAEEAVASCLSTGQSDWSDPVSHRSM
ncbi:MAG: VOC family protein [Acidobacteriota bacterium]|nr:VOC family protein [Acidobacteriota bacterium]